MQNYLRLSHIVAEFFPGAGYNLTLFLSSMRQIGWYKSDDVTPNDNENIEIWLPVFCLASFYL